jgi:hypothetical protein
MGEILAEEAIDAMPSMQCDEILAKVDIAAQVVRPERPKV